MYLAVSGGNPLPIGCVRVTLWLKGHVNQKWTVFVVDELLDQPTGLSLMTLSMNAAPRRPF
jgi:hypothetical protein